MGRFETTISESPDTTEMNVMAKKAKTTSSDDYEDNGTMDDPTEPVVEEEKIDPSVPEDPQFVKDQTFKAQPTNPPPPDELKEVDVDKLSESTKAEMKAGKEASEKARGGSATIGEAEGKAGRDNGDRYK
jgi:hypothetical protein